MKHYILKLSPQPQVPLIFGLLKTNSLVRMSSTKSISVPKRDSWAFASINIFTPVKKQTNTKQLKYYFQIFKN